MQARPRAKSPELWGRESLLGGGGGMAEEDTCFLVTKAGEEEAGREEMHRLGNYVPKLKLRQSHQVLVFQFSTVV